MPRPIEAVISPAAIAHNLGAVRKSAPGARVWGVVKANAYGHGLARVLPAVAQADGLALLDLAEARLLREAGYTGPILLLEGCFAAEDVAVARHLGLHVVVHCNEQIRLLETAGAGAPLHVYLKMNSGMNRLGFAPEDLRARHAALASLAAVASITLMTHFARAESPDGIDEALARFQAATHDLPGERSLSNSAATLAHAKARGDWVRPGIALYGSSPFAERSAQALGLEAAMTLSSELIAIQQLRPGESVGYGGRFVATVPMRIGVVACGYADGYPRIAPDGTPVLVAGHRTRVVGAVSMDMLTVDLTGVEQAQVGAPVELWGTRVSVDEVAHAAGTVGYELLCALAPRVPVRLGA
jgi:alanine racemase